LFIVFRIASEQEWMSSGCAPGATRQRFNNQSNGCVKTKAHAPFFLSSPKKGEFYLCLLYILNIKQTLLWLAAFAKLPVGSCDVTIAFFATVTGVGRSTYAVQWGNDANIANLQVYYP